MDIGGGTGKWNLFVRIIIFNHVLIYIDSLARTFYLSIYGDHFVIEKADANYYGQPSWYCCSARGQFLLQTSWFSKFGCYYLLCFLALRSDWQRRAGGGEPGVRAALPKLTGAAVGTIEPWKPRAPGMCHRLPLESLDVHSFGLFVANCRAYWSVVMNPLNSSHTCS